MFTRTQGAVRDIPVESFGASFQPQGQFGSAMNIHPTLAKTSQPRFLMCPPRHFAVAYSINPWMDRQAWGQWAELRHALAAAGAAIETLEPAPGLPDLVFTANARSCSTARSCSLGLGSVTGRRMSNALYHRDNLAVLRRNRSELLARKCPS
jgi:hypothetical protein